MESRRRVFRAGDTEVAAVCPAWGSSMRTEGLRRLCSDEVRVDRVVCAGASDRKQRPARRVSKSVFMIRILSGGESSVKDDEAKVGAGAGRRQILPDERAYPATNRQNQPLEGGGEWYRNLTPTPQIP